jgi:hypothetical protein
MAKKRKAKKSKKEEKEKSTYGWPKGTKEKLFLDRPFLALSNLSKNKNGKEVPVHVQISDYLKSMGMLEQKDVIRSIILKEFENIISEKRVRKKINGRMYTSTESMVRAVEAYRRGKIGKEELYEMASWAENPEDAISVASAILNN